MIPLLPLQRAAPQRLCCTAAVPFAVRKATSAAGSSDCRPAAPETRALALPTPWCRALGEQTQPPLPEPRCFSRHGWLPSQRRCIPSSADKQGASTPCPALEGPASDLGHPYSRSTLMPLALSFIRPTAIPNSENPE